MLTAVLISTMASLPAQPLSIHEAVERATERAFRFEMSVSPDGRSGRARAGLPLGHYFGILAWDWVTTDISTGAQDAGEMNPLPLMGTRVGRAVTMSLIAAGWTVLDKALVSHGRVKAAKALRFVLGMYGANIVSWNLGWQRAFTPDNLIPPQWRRDSGHSRDYSMEDSYGAGQTQRAYDACVRAAAHPGTALERATGPCWK